MGDTRLDWDKVRVFKAVADAGSMAGAAAKLRESPATVSRKIDDLERSLGVELLARSSRGVELTEAGKAAFRYAETAADAMSALQNDVSGLDQMDRGSVRIAAGDGLGPHWIAPRLPQFHREHPKIEISLHITDQPVSLTDSDFDIAIQFAEPTNRDVIARRLGVLHYMLFASPQYTAVYGKPKNLFELHTHRLLFHSGYVNQITRWSPKTADLGQLLDFALITNSGAVMREACAAGGGIALLPSYATEFDSRLQPVGIEVESVIQFWPAYTERAKRLPRVQIVLEWLRDIFDTTQHVWFRESFVMPEARDEAADDAAPASARTAADSK